MQKDKKTRNRIKYILFATVQKGQWFALLRFGIVAWAQSQHNRKREVRPWETGEGQGVADLREGSYIKGRKARS
jgi:hypothetical protein